VDNFLRSVDKIAKINVRGMPYTVSRKKEERMNEILNTQLELDLAKANLAKMEELGIAKEEDFEEVYWLELKLANLKRNEK